jgi:hypothetical protein
MTYLSQLWPVLIAVVLVSAAALLIRMFWRRDKGVSDTYWLHFVRWVQACITIPLFLTVFAIDPIRTHHFPLGLFIVPVLVGYGRSLRYLTIRRYDESVWSQILTYLTAPLVVMWTYWIAPAAA